MTVLTKGEKARQPRCEHMTVRGERCRLHSLVIEDGKHACVHHRHGSRKKSKKSRPLVIPKEAIYIATYSDGQTVQRKDLPAVSRDEAYRVAMRRAPRNSKLIHLRIKSKTGEAK